MMKSSMSSLILTDVLVSGLQHVELPIPKPKKDELLVKVEACSINPIDWKVQKGFMKPVLPFRFPHVPGEIKFAPRNL